MKDSIKAFALIFLGFLASSFIFFFSSFEEKKESVDSIVILEKIKSVSKLVTVEGQYANLYQFEDYRWMNCWPFRKSISIRVRLKALAGVNLEKMKITPDEERKVFVIDSIPDIELISLDPQIEYFNMDESLFNHYGSVELNRINQTIREMSESAFYQVDKPIKNPIDSILMHQYSSEMKGFFEPLSRNGKEEAKKTLQMIKDLCKITGWDLEFTNTNRIKI